MQAGFFFAKPKGDKERRFPNRCRTTWGKGAYGILRLLTNRHLVIFSLPQAGGIAQLVERLVRNDAGANTLTFSYALLTAPP